MLRRQARSAVVLLSVVAFVPAYAATLSRQHADVFSQKIAVIRGRAESPVHPGTQRTRLTEDEFNSWFLYRAERWRKLVPTGVVQPQVTIVGQGQLAAQAVVDLEALSKRRGGSNGSFDPLSLIGGTVPVSVLGVLHTQAGRARFEVQSAQISGIPVPVSVLQELVGYYSRTPQRPEGLRLDQTFTLPAGIRHVEIGRGQAVVVQ